MPGALPARPARRLAARRRRQLHPHRGRGPERPAGAGATLHPGARLMDLILWRHAEAFEMREVEDDMKRALTPKGERQAQRMAEWLGQRLAHSTRILVSP